MPLHADLESDFPKFAAQLASRFAEPFLVEHVLPPASEDQIARLATELGVPLPNSYQRLLRRTRGFWLSGGCIQLSSQYPFFHNFPPLTQLTPIQRRTLEWKGGGWPPPSQGMLCFAEFWMEWDGDQALWDVSQGLRDGEYPVFYYAHEARPPSVRKIAASFGEWLDHCLDAFPPHAEVE